MINDACNLPDNARWEWFDDFTVEIEAEEAAEAVRRWEDGFDDDTE